MLLLLYPDIAYFQHARRHDAYGQERDSKLMTMSEVEISNARRLAQEHNDRLREFGVVTPIDGSHLLEDYYNLLSINNIMGRVYIPSINQNLPIHHGISDDTLDIAVGHLPHTHLPIGGEYNHSVLTAHTGLIYAPMFTHLNRVEIGDIFIIETLGEELVYRVDKIETVLPHEFQSVTINDSRDIVTLITCTPYGLNTHRLLVRGERILDEEEIEELVEAVEIRTPINIRHSIAGISTFIFGLMLLLAFIAKRKGAVIIIIDSDEEYTDEEIQEILNKIDWNEKI